MNLRLLAVSLIAMLLAPGAAQARTVGVSPGDTAVYSYVYDFTNSAPGGNVTFTSTNQFSIDVFSVDNQSALGAVGYTITWTEANSSVLSTPEVFQNFTTIFDPRDNLTYTGRIGFWPFIYTDVPAGSFTNMMLVVETATNASAVTNVWSVNGTVVRNPGSIDVSLRIGGGDNAPARMNMQYNSTTGILENMTGAAQYVSIIWRYATYHLLSFSHSSPLDLSFLPYVVVAAIAAVVVLTYRRRTKREKKAAKFRERMA